MAAEQQPWNCREDSIIVREAIFPRWTDADDAEFYPHLGELSTETHDPTQLSISSLDRSVSIFGDSTLLRDPHSRSASPSYDRAWQYDGRNLASAFGALYTPGQGFAYPDLEDLTNTGLPRYPLSTGVDAGTVSRSEYRCQVEGCTFKGTFGRRYELDRHMATTHLKQDAVQFVCPLVHCHRRGYNGFPRADKLRDHIRLGHARDFEDLFTCPFPDCDYGPGKKDSIIEHIPIHWHLGKTGEENLTESMQPKPLAFLNLEHMLEHLAGLGSPELVSLKGSGQTKAGARGSFGGPPIAGSTADATRVPVLDGPDRLGHDCSRPMSVTDSEVSELSCPECSKCFSRRSDLRRHRGQTHEHQERTFVCGDCHKGFFWAKDLTRHRKIHSKDLPGEKQEQDSYRCKVEGCETAPFFRKDNFKRHMRRMHRDLHEGD